jgi:hypothetical protein
MPVTTLVGRDGVRAELAAAVRGALVVLTGEPGIGKTRLLSEVDGLAAGATVVRGSCWDDGAPAFWPWTQVLRECAGGRGAAELLADWGPGARDALGLVPELAALEDERARPRHGHLADPGRPGPHREGAPGARPAPADRDSHRDVLRSTGSPTTPRR